jgi:hypothetical protein
LVPFADVAQNSLNSGDQQTPCHSLFTDAEREVQVIPFGEVITLSVPVLATAQNKPSSGDQQTLYHPLSAALVLEVQLIPSGEVITLFPIPE